MKTTNKRAAATKATKTGKALGKKGQKRIEKAQTSGAKSGARARPRSPLGKTKDKKISLPKAGSSSAPQPSLSGRCSFCKFRPHSPISGNNRPLLVEEAEKIELFKKFMTELGYLDSDSGNEGFGEDEDVRYCVPCGIVMKRALDRYKETVSEIRAVLDKMPSMEGGEENQGVEESQMSAIVVKAEEEFDEDVSSYQEDVGDVGEDVLGDENGGLEGAGWVGGEEKEGRKSSSSHQGQGSRLRENDDSIAMEENGNPSLARGQSDPLEDSITPRENNPPVDTGNSTHKSQTKRPRVLATESVDEDEGLPLPEEITGCKVPQRKKQRSATSNLEAHLRTHTKEKPFPCPHCGQEFAIKRNMKEHIIRRHMKEKSFKCPQEGCIASFATESDLKRHSRIHSGEKPYRCNLCGKRFSDKGNLYRHIRYHLKERWFKCPHPGCASSFVTGADLKKHGRTHSGEKPFTCPLEGCGKTFTQTSNLATHRRKCSGGGN